MRIYIEVCRVATGSILRGLIRAIVGLRVLFLNLISFKKNATTRAVGEKKISQLSVSSAVRMISLVVLLITAQLKFTVIYRPISMKQRYGAPFLGLAKSIYKVFVRRCV